jgi:hypothetical protein
VPAGPRLGPEEVRYLGAFRLAEDRRTTHGTLEYSNGALAYHPAGNGGRGSLLVAGHVHRSLVAEYEVPAPVASRELDRLPVARMLHPFTDVLAGVRNRAGNGFIMSMAFVPGPDRVVFAHGSDYSDGGCVVTAGLGSVGWFGPTLDAPDTGGLWLLSARGRTLPQFESGRYVVALPPGWATAAGREAPVASGRHRNWCAMGPNLFAWTPGDEPPGSVVPAVPLMHFGPEGDTGRQSREFSHADNYTGAAWLEAGGRQALVITGVKDWEPARSYYGYEGWTYPARCEPARTCRGDRGWRAADPRPTLLFFDPAELAQVARGARPAHAPRWYARLDLAPHALRTYPATFLTTGATAETFLATVDPAARRLYLSESYVDGDPPVRPVVHVFQVGPVG